MSFDTTRYVDDMRQKIGKLKPYPIFGDVTDAIEEFIVVMSQDVEVQGMLTLDDKNLLIKFWNSMFRARDDIEVYLTIAVSEIILAPDMNKDLGLLLFHTALAVFSVEAFMYLQSKCHNLVKIQNSNSSDIVELLRVCTVYNLMVTCCLSLNALKIVFPAELGNESLGINFHNSFIFELNHALPKIKFVESIFIISKCKYKVDEQSVKSHFNKERNKLLPVAIRRFSYKLRENIDSVNSLEQLLMQISLVWHNDANIEELSAFTDKIYSIGFADGWDATFESALLTIRRICVYISICLIKMIDRADTYIVEDGPFFLKRLVNLLNFIPHSVLIRGNLCIINHMGYIVLLFRILAKKLGGNSETVSFRELENLVQNHLSLLFVIHMNSVVKLEDIRHAIPCLFDGTSIDKVNLKKNWMNIINTEDLESGLLKMPCGKCGSSIEAIVLPCLHAHCYMCLRKRVSRNPGKSIKCDKGHEEEITNAISSLTLELLKEEVIQIED